MPAVISTLGNGFNNHGALSMASSATPDVCVRQNHGSSTRPNQAENASTPPNLQFGRDGDVFVLLNLPQGSQVGCDTTAVTVKDPPAELASRVAFSGFRDLPPGAHFVWVSSQNAMSRQGYWFITHKAPAVIRIKKWDNLHEALGDHTAQHPAQHAARSLDADVVAAFTSLLPYHAGGGGTSSRLPSPQTRGSKSSQHISVEGSWASLTSCITESVLGRITGDVPSPMAALKEWLVSTADTTKEEVVLPALSQPSGHTELKFLFPKHELDPYKLIASRTVNGLAIPATARDAHTVDTTERIVALLEQSLQPTRLTDVDVIGELQFAFLTGTLLSNLSCLDQWWHLVLKIFLRAHAMITRRPALCSAFLRSLYGQLVYVERHSSHGLMGLATDGPTAEGEEGSAVIFDANPQGATRLRTSLTNFKLHLDDILKGSDGTAPPPGVAAVEQDFANLEAFLRKYGWDLRQDGVSNEPFDSVEDDDNDDDDDYIDFNYDVPNLGARPRKRENHVLADTDSDSDQPILVELDENGREVGLISWD